MKAIWDLEEKSFIFVKATALLLTPFLNIFIVSSVDETYS
jgi:hypothetical protein